MHLRIPQAQIGELAKLGTLAILGRQRMILSDETRVFFILSSIS